jgi:NNP family nitrate/nitrite transporter-like MFS transporter
MNTTRQSWTALTLSTLAFAVSFAVWGMLAPMAKSFQPAFHISKQQAWLMVAAPVLLGSIMRLPMGMLTDRYGGRVVFGALMMFSAIPAFMLSRAQTYTDLMVWAFPLGMAGASFAIGVPFTSRWFPKERQGMSLGIFGAGNIGQSVAVFGVPVLARSMGGWRGTFQMFAAVILVYGLFFLLAARNSPV